jgi:hypothetical protein
MAFDDLDIARPTPPASTPPPGPPIGRWIVVALAAVAAGTLLTFWWMSNSQPTPAPPPAAAVTGTAPESNRPKRQPLDLPPLDGSDLFLRGLVSALSNHPTLARLLTTPDLARGTALAMVQIGDGRTPSQPLRLLRPSARLRVDGATSGAIDPISYRRWDSAASALVSVPPADAAQLYVNVKPLLDEALIDLGQPRDFDASLVRAISLLRETPVPAHDPVLLRRPGYFEHEDPALRALKPVQKQLVLLGPHNQRRVIDWLEAFARALDLDVE